MSRTVPDFGASAARRPAFGLLDTIGGAVAAVWLWRFRSRTRHGLARLDDHLLRDIGLDRAAQEREAAKPFWRA